MTLTLNGQLPSGKNAMQVTRRGLHYPKTRFKLWRKDACQQLIGQFQETIAWRTEMTVDYTPGDLITRDVSGLMDALFHLFGYAGVIKDDGLIRNVTWREHPLNRKHPQCHIELNKL